MEDKCRNIISVGIVTDSAFFCAGLETVISENEGIMLTAYKIGIISKPRLEYQGVAEGCRVGETAPMRFVENANN